VKTNNLPKINGVKISEEERTFVCYSLESEEFSQPLRKGGNDESGKPRQKNQKEH
jgi:hypothetical protein